MCEPAFKAIVVPQAHTPAGPMGALRVRGPCFVFRNALWVVVLLTLALCDAARGQEGGRPTPEDTVQYSVANETRPTKKWSKELLRQLDVYEARRNLTTEQGKIVNALRQSGEKVDFRGLGISMDHRMSYKSVQLMTANLHYNMQRFVDDDGRLNPAVLNEYRRFEAFQRTMGYTIPESLVAETTGKPIGYYSDKLGESLNPRLSETEQRARLREIIDGMADDPSNIRWGDSRINSSLGSTYDPVVIRSVSPGMDCLSPTSGNVQDEAEKLVEEGLLDRDVMRAATQPRVAENKSRVSSSQVSPVNERAESVAISRGVKRFNESSKEPRNEAPAPKKRESDRP